jgi:hypothetical protein
MTRSTSNTIQESATTIAPTQIIIGESPAKLNDIPHNKIINMETQETKETEESEKDCSLAQEYPITTTRIPDNFSETTNLQTNSTPNTLSRQPESTTIYNPYQKKPSSKGTVTQTPEDPTHQHHDNASSTNQLTLNAKSAPFVAINDGTYRLTLRWKPIEYHELGKDPDYWINKVYGLIDGLFGLYKSKIWIVKWEASKNNDICSLGDIFAMKGKLREYMSPKVAHLDSTGQFVFGLRITMRNQSPAAWITDSRTNNIMSNENLHVNISHSKCDSGEVVVAGHLLLKHPEHTHKIFYLMALRQQLPEATPFFDIGHMSTAPNGKFITWLSDAEKTMQMY